ncbi:MAG: GspE/PulE family protein, partial [Planctomycetota bacterium]
VLLDELRHKIGQSIKPVVVTRADIEAVAEALKVDESEEAAVSMDDVLEGIDEDDVEVVEENNDDLDLEKMAGESPVIRYVNYLIFNAVKEGASDIHIEPQEKKLRVRYRIDGVMFDATNPPNHMRSAIISRIKIMANLDIAERRLPQDGRIRAMVHGRKLDLRVSTLPMVQGEKCVMRILDTRSIQVDLDDLGMDQDSLQIWKQQIDQPHGIVLVTGPTGSGKTTTLYASLGKMNRDKLNISTAEDPVEYHLNGINQTQTHASIGMTFAAALRALLRQDPDVIMVGEIRDVETAKTAIEASLTGHLVLSTLHTNDAPSAITRLINIGVEPYLIGSAVNGVLAQRLVRKICEHCKTQAPPDETIAEHLAMQGIAMDEVWKGAGCDKCRGTGYAGRLGIYEMLVLNDNLRDRVASNPNVTEFRRMCVEGGMVTLREDGFRKVAAGKTTVDEVLRVTES